MKLLRNSLYWTAAIALLSSCEWKSPQLKDDQIAEKKNTISAPPTDTPSASSSEPSSLTRTLTDSKGRKIEATIVGHEPGFITIVRKLDQQTFRLAVTDLSNSDQDYVKALPMFGESPEEAEADKNSEPESRDIASFQKKRIADIDREIEELKKEKEAYKPNSINWRSLHSKILRLQSEKQKLLTEIR